MKVAAFRHLFSEGLGSLVQVIEKAGGSHQYVDSYREDIESFDVLAPDLLIILGGAPGVYQADDYPFLHTEMKLIEKRLSKDLPTLGICLGAQMMAKVLGSNVYKGDNGPEIGWFPLTLTREGKHSALRCLDGRETHMLQWHQDTYDLPKGATLLASSERYQSQAYRYGKNALGLQFHCEITPAMLKGWSVSGAALVADGRLDLKKLRADTETHGPCLIEKAEQFLLQWLKETGVIDKGHHHA